MYVLIPVTDPANRSELDNDKSDVEKSWKLNESTFRSEVLV